MFGAITLCDAVDASCSRSTRAPSGCRAKACWVRLRASPAALTDPARGPHLAGGPRHPLDPVRLGGARAPLDLAGGGHDRRRLVMISHLRLAIAAWCSPASIPTSPACKGYRCACSPLSSRLDGRHGRASRPARSALCRSSRSRRCPRLAALVLGRRLKWAFAVAPALGARSPGRRIPVRVLLRVPGRRQPDPRGERSSWPSVPGAHARTLGGPGRIQPRRPNRTAKTRHQRGAPQSTRTVLRPSGTGRPRARPRGPRRWPRRSATARATCRRRRRRPGTLVMLVLVDRHVAARRRA